MPGITGLITRMPRAQAEERLSRMVNALCHEKFYETGTWVDESLGVYVGWALRPGSFSSGMPVSNDRGDVALVFSGEEYSGDAIAQASKTGKTPSSYILNRHEENP